MHSNVTWQSSFIYGTLVMASVHTLVFITVDRYLAVFHALLYKLSQKKIIIISQIYIYALSTSINLNLIFQQKIVNDSCTGGNYFPENYFEVNLKIYAVFWLLMVYVIPLTIFIVVYTKLVIFFRKSMASDYIWYFSLTIPYITPWQPSTFYRYTRTIHWSRK